MFMFRPQQANTEPGSVAWDGPCPALLPDNRCGLIEAPERFFPFRVAVRGKEMLSAAAAQLVGAGCGCDAQVDGEPDNQEFRDAMRRRSNHHRTEAALRVWGITRVML